MAKKSGKFLMRESNGRMVRVTGWFRGATGRWTQLNREERHDRMRKVIFALVGAGFPEREAPRLVIAQFRRRERGR